MKKNLEEVEAERQKILDRAKDLEEKEKQAEEFARQAEDAKLTTIDEILAGTDKIIDVYIPELKTKIQIKPLTVKDWLELQQYKDNQDKYAAKLLTLLWQKTDPAVTEEKVGRLPLQVLASILNRFPNINIYESKVPLSQKRGR